MRLKNLIFIPCLFFFLNIWFNVSLAFSAWPTDPSKNLAICTATNFQRLPKICSDGSGGAIITWEDCRTYTINSIIAIYAQAVDNNGNLKWVINGVPICGQSDKPVICEDSNGGAIIAWSAGFDAYAQAINSTGVVKWVTNGVFIHNISWYPQICSDGSGGAIIAWSAPHDIYDVSNIYAQAISPSGALKWNSNGVSICTAMNRQYTSQICSDGSGGAIIVWLDNRDLEYGQWYIYAQAIDTNGVPKWKKDGVAVSIYYMVTEVLSPSISSDESGGIIITWENMNDNIYAQAVGSTGVKKWGANGVAICNLLQQHYPQICSDGSGGAIITWENWVSGTANIYAQSVSSSGIIRWNNNGVAICPASANQTSPQICSDGQGGAIVTWEDQRMGNYDLYAQSISSTGVAKWQPGGVVISNATGDQRYPQIYSDSAGGAIIVWEDTRNGSGNSDIYAQRIYWNGGFFPPAKVDSNWFLYE